VKYVCLMIGGFYVRFTVPFGLDVQGAGPGDSTIFRRTELGNDQVTLQLVATGAFLNARGGAAELGAEGPESTWTEAWWPNDQISLRSSFRLFLCAERGGGNQLVANRDAAGAWEKFFYAQPPVELLPAEPAPPARATLGKRRLGRDVDPTGPATEADLNRTVPRLDNP
jgi:hypothetical protein